MALLSGKTGYVTVGGLAFRFGKWSLPMTCRTPAANNFVDAPYEVYVSGLLGAKLTCSGPYDAGNMPLVIGNAYVFVLGFTPGIFLTTPAIVNGLTATDDVEGNPQIEVSAQVSGVFTINIV